MNANIQAMQAEILRLQAAVEKAEDEEKVQRAAEAARKAAEVHARLPGAVVDLAREAVMNRKRALLAYMDRDAEGNITTHRNGQPREWELSIKIKRPRVVLPAEVHHWLQGIGVPAFQEYHERGIEGVAALWGTTRAKLCEGGVTPKTWYAFLNSAAGSHTPYDHTFKRVQGTVRYVLQGTMSATVGEWFAGLK